ncbi:MAG TPA: hypothetical protein PLB50_05030 [Candidatus Saccharicenans sp.]|jgi:hypothetical protein|nr:hypothetical protein [Candidatus Saccharicenans sp.]HQO76025.1 hypothetical protein [Candidatus Saccharicenans sp.]HUM78910.1 hypothetical protein [Candidatus Saccharicenans sp.]
MKRKVICLAILMLFCLSVGGLQAQAQEKKLGLGFIVGEPTGVIAKYWTSNRTAFDIAGSWSFSGENAFHLHADYLLHSFIKVETGKLAFYYGIGARLNLQDDARFGIKIPLGLSYTFPNTPIDIFFEISPVMDLIPDTELKFLGFVGVRYFF